MLSGFLRIRSTYSQGRKLRAGGLASRSSEERTSPMHDIVSAMGPAGCFICSAMPRAIQSPESADLDDRHVPSVKGFSSISRAAPGRSGMAHFPALETRGVPYGGYHSQERR